MYSGVPGIIAGGVTQLNIAVGTIIASLQDGANAMLYFADRLYQLPLGVIGIGIGVVLLPSLTRQLRAGETGAYQVSLNRALEISLVLTLPAAVALAVVPHEIVSVLFQRVRFDAAAVDGTAAALMAFSFGLPAFVLNKVFSPGYFAREDTKTPMKFAAVGMAVNVCLSLALFPVFKHVGIALATTIAGWVNTALLIVVLYKTRAFRARFHAFAAAGSGPAREPSDGCGHPLRSHCARTVSVTGSWLVSSGPQALACWS